MNSMNSMYQMSFNDAAILLLFKTLAAVGGHKQNSCVLCAEIYLTTKATTEMTPPISTTWPTSVPTDVSKTLTSAASTYGVLASILTGLLVLLVVTLIVFAWYMIRSTHQAKTKGRQNGKFSRRV